MKRKWIILVTYNSQGADYIVLVRMSKDGMLHFKTKRLTKVGRISYYMKNDNYDPKTQLNSLIPKP